jgi:hypothetical protein
MTKWNIGLCIAMATAVGSTDRVFAMQHRVYDCQSAYHRCVLWCDDHKDTTDLAKCDKSCDKRLSDALSSGDNTTGYWQNPTGSLMCLKKPL